MAGPALPIQLQEGNLRKQFRALRDADDWHLQRLKSEREQRAQALAAYERRKQQEGETSALAKRVAELEERLDMGELRLHAGLAAFNECQRYREIVLAKYEAFFRELLLEASRDTISRTSEYIQQQVARVEADFEVLRRELASKLGVEFTGSA